jgi:hypothetical protein
MTKALRDESKKVAQAAKMIAEDRGLQRTGDLVRGIKGGAAGSVGYVKSTVERDGFGYGSVYEYGPAARPFLRPAVQQKAGEIQAAFEDALDNALKKNDRPRTRGGGGSFGGSSGGGFNAGSFGRSVMGGLSGNARRQTGRLGSAANMLKGKGMRTVADLLGRL